MSEKSQCIPELSNFCLTVGRNAELLQPITTWLRAVACFYFELLLANDWSLGFLRFWFLQHSLENCAKGTYLGIRASNDKENCYPTG